MIEKIKYGFAKLFACKQMRLAGIAIMTAITIAVVTLLNSSIYTINIFDGVNTYTVHTLNNSVTTALSGVGLKSQNYSIDNTTVKGRTTSVEISYEFPVFITCGDKTTEISFLGGTVRDALKKADIEVDEFDFVEPSLDTVINGTVYIDYSDVSYVSGNYTEAIPFKNETVYSNQQKKGYEKTVATGKNGVKQIEYKEKFVNGVSEGKTVVSETVVEEAVNGKKIVGTKEEARAVSSSNNVKSISVLNPGFSIDLDANGNPVNYKSKMTVRATAYTYTGKNCATGVAPKPGYIAVNPKVIPYGTKMYIKSPDGSIVYGYAVAADTGGFVKRHPNGIDLFMSTRSECRNFGVRNMEVYIIG